MARKVGDPGREGGADEVAELPPEECAPGLPCDDEPPFMYGANQWGMMIYLCELL